MPETTLIKIDELSRRLSIPKGTIYNWVYQRRIPFGDSTRKKSSNRCSITRYSGAPPRSRNSGLDRGLSGATRL